MWTKLRNWSHLPKESSMENFIFCAVFTIQLFEEVDHYQLNWFIESTAKGFSKPMLHIGYILRITVLQDPEKGTILNANLPPTATAQKRSFSIRNTYVNTYVSCWGFTKEILNINLIFMVWISKFSNLFNVLFYYFSYPIHLDFLFLESSGLLIWKSL